MRRLSEYTLLAMLWTRLPNHDALTDIEISSIVELYRTTFDFVGRGGCRHIRGDVVGYGGGENYNV